MREIGPRTVHQWKEKSKMQKQLLTPKEAAQLLGVKVNTLYIWALQRKVPSIKLGRCRRFDEDELIALIKRNRVEDL
jgi:excisionase family DNA binding protein